jgi:hypothetical protein
VPHRHLHKPEFKATTLRPPSSYLLGGFFMTIMSTPQARAALLYFVKLVEWSCVMSNLLEQAIHTDDGERAAKIIQHALGIESDNASTTAFR